MGLLQRIADAFNPQKQVTAPMSAASLSSAWTDIDATTAEPLAILRPINIKRTMLSRVVSLCASDELTVRITKEDQYGRVVERADTPTFPVFRPMLVDSVTKFEVIDEFGVDVGIGFVLGEAKR